MCRIAAIISKHTSDLTDQMVQMTDAMKHGGPDGEGLYLNESLGLALGHRRLSIIDITEAGHQPMSYLQQRYWITYNGEIYNYASLKEELIVLGYTFENHTDTEVILAGYDAWGGDVLNRLKGMFAFILADTFAGQLFIARDAMGIKPLYMAKRGADFYFSSEVKAFLEIDPLWEPNKEWQIWFLTFGFLPEPITTLQNVWPITKGHCMLFDLKDHSYRQWEWFDKEAQADEPVSSKDAIYQTRQLIEASVQQQLVSDVDTAVMLSGGIDSSILAVLASENGKKKINTLSIDFEDPKYSEKKYQDIIVSQIHSNHHSIKISKKEFLAAWDDIYRSIDQPTNDAVNCYFISKYAKELGIKVIFSGIGADEVFGGYPSFHKTSRIRFLQRMAFIIKGMPDQLAPYPFKKLTFLKKKITASEYLLYRGLFTPGDVADILHLPVQKVWEVIGRFQFPDAHADVVGAKSTVSAYEIDIYMANQLLKDADSQSMWHGVEVRVPFLDTNLVSFVQNLPDSVKYPTGKHKYLLLEAFRDIIPSSILKRKKQGFVFPFDIWLRDLNILRNVIYVPEKFFRKFQKLKINYSRIWSIFLVNMDDNIRHFSTLYTPPIRPQKLFLFLSGFDKTGGIEKVNRVILHSLKRQGENAADAISLHDNYFDVRYFSRYYFIGFGGRKIRFFIHLIKNSFSWKQVVVGHINLAPAVWLMRMINPTLEIKVLVHGIEAWKPQKGFAKWMLKKASLVISVSEYTKEKLVSQSGIRKDKIKVLPNCLDPFYTVPARPKSQYLLERYGITSSQKVILTITRINTTEKYKGYDHVLLALSEIHEENIVYLIGGQADEIEKNRILQLVKSYHLEDRVILTGFIPTDELTDHYQLADVFIMPSKKEGFGIVLIEAAAAGVAVIAGNCDGSVEALKNGELGQLVNPDDIDAIRSAIFRSFALTQESLKLIQEKTLSYYNPVLYKQRFLKLIDL